MVDHQSNAPGSSAPEPLSLTAFAASLYHAQRADNFFKFLKNFSEEDLANFLQGLLRQVGDAIEMVTTTRSRALSSKGRLRRIFPRRPLRRFARISLMPRSPHCASRCGKLPWPFSAQEQSTW